MADTIRSLQSLRARFAAPPDRRPAVFRRVAPLVTRRQFLGGAAATATLLALSGGIALGFTVQDVWMETPDVLAFTVDDDPMYLGGITAAYQDESGTAWGVYVQRENRSKVGNPVEWCQVIGPNKDFYSFSSLPSPNFVNRVALRDYTKYTITGGAGLTVTAAYYRNEAIGQGQFNRATPGPTQDLTTQWRMAVYLQLGARPVPGQQYTISHADTAVDNFNFTFNDKVTRAGGIKTSFAGHRRDDPHKKAYLCSRLPGAPNHGVVDFAAYGVSDFYIIDPNGWPWFRGTITLRRAWNEFDVNQGYDTGIDVGDIGDIKTITGITKGATTTIDCVGHGLVDGDKVRLWGISNIDSFEAATPTSEPGLWKGATVTVNTPDQISININSSGFAGTFSTTPDYDASLGGFANKLVKCFTTNRAATSVWEMDYSAWRAPAFGEYRIYIPGYGVSDPFRIDDACWNKVASLEHQGCYNLRLGCAVNRSGTYVRDAALVDGYRGCVLYRSNLPAIAASEYSQAITPSGGALAYPAGFGGYEGGNGTQPLASITRSGSTATATTTSPHGFPIGSTAQVNISGASSGYNSANNDLSTGNHTLITITGASTFTYALVGTPASPAAAPGLMRTGMLTNVRATGTRGAAQDAGDNDDVAADHLPGQRYLAAVFYDIPKQSRYTSFQVQASSTLLDPVLFPASATDNLPPIFHELFWYAEQYRTQQDGNGDIPGGIGLGGFSSQIAPGREPIDYSHGFDAGGNMAGTFVQAFWYAPDHLSTACWAAHAAKLALIAYDYNLTSLGDAYRDSAVAAWDRAFAVLTNIATCDAHYITTLGLPARLNWTTAQYREFLSTINGRVITALYDAAGALYRLFGSVAGQTPYGDWIDSNYVTAISSIAAGGSGYAVGDLIICGGNLTGMRDAPMFRVLTVDGGGAVLTTSIYYAGSFTSRTNPISQTSTTGGGSGATFNVNITNIYSSPMDQSLGANDYYRTPGRKDAPANYFASRATAGNASTTAAAQIGPNTCFNAPISPGSTSGGAQYSGAIEFIECMLVRLAVNGDTVTMRQTEQMKAMMAGKGFSCGANGSPFGKSFLRGLGPRHYQCLMHEDSFKMGVVSPIGITPFGWFAWASNTLVFNFQITSNPAGPCDSSSTWLAQNISGLAESNPQPGHTKLWTPWRFGNGYWEWAPENRGIIFGAEYSLNTLPVFVGMSLLLHALGGNDATEYSDRRFGWGPR